MVINTNTDCWIPSEVLAEPSDSGQLVSDGSLSLDWAVLLGPHLKACSELNVKMCVKTL